MKHRQIDILADFFGESPTSMVNGLVFMANGCSHSHSYRFKVDLNPDRVKPKEQIWTGILTSGVGNYRTENKAIVVIGLILIFLFFAWFASH